MGGVCALYIRVGAKKPVEEESEVSFSEPTQASNESREIEGHKVTGEPLEELFGGLDALMLSDDAAEEDKRKELYAIAASVYA